MDLPFDVLKDMVSQLSEAELDELRQCIESRQVGRRKGKWRTAAKQQAEDADDLIDWEFVEYAKREADFSVTLEEVRAILVKVPDSLSAAVIAERADEGLQVINPEIP